MPDRSALEQPTELTAISLGGAVAGEGGALHQLATAIDEACRATGFFAIVDHGVSTTVVRDALAAGCSFFSLPAQVKDRYRSQTAPGIQRGYAGLGAEAQAAAVGAETLPDLSETFSIAPVRSATPPDRWTADDVWPDDAVPELRPALTRMRADLDALGRLLLRACALALRGDERAFEPLLTRPLGGLRINHYPELPEPPAAGQWRGGAHTDYGTLTVLATDRSAGLEIQVGGEWIPMTTPRDGFLVNVGDILSALSEGRWPSTWHRVAVPSGTGPFPARTSIAFFQYPNAEAIVSGLGDTTQLAGEYLEEKVRRIGAASGADDSTRSREEPQ